MAQSSILTRGEIVTAGMQLGGNTNITTRCNEFLNLFLDSLHRQHDWQQLKKTTTLTTTVGTATVSLSSVTDYSRMVQVHIARDLNALQEMRYEDLLIKTDNDAASAVKGDPTCYAIEPDQTDLLLWPIPQTSETVKLVYIYSPTEISADATVPWFDDAKVLVEAVAEFAMRYDKEPMFQIANSLVELQLRKAAGGLDDVGRNSPRSVRFGANVYSLRQGRDG